MKKIANYAVLLIRYAESFYGIIRSPHFHKVMSGKKMILIHVEIEEL